jgi:hypothetical protein
MCSTVPGFVLVVAHLSDEFSIQISLKQGDVVSPLVFNFGL